MDDRVATRTGRDESVSSSSWLLVETLGSGCPTVIGADGRARSMSSLARVLQCKVGGKSASALWRDAAEVIEHVRKNSRAEDRTVLVAGRPTRILGRPVAAKDGLVHGVQLWVGDANVDPPSHSSRTSLAVTFLSDQRAIEIDNDHLKEAFGPKIVDRPTPFTLPELFEHVTVDDSLSMMTKLLAPSAVGCIWEGSMTTRTLSEAIRLHAVLAAVGKTEWRGLIHIVLGDAPLPTTFESAALDVLHTVAPQTAIAVTDITHNRLIRWLTEPLPGILWRGVRDNRDTPHPNDVDRIFEVATRLRSGSVMSATIDDVRLRRLNGGWTTVDINCSPLPRDAAGNVHLLLVSFKATGINDDPDPVALTDQGRPSLATTDKP